MILTYTYVSRIRCAFRLLNATQSHIGDNPRVEWSVVATSTLQVLQEALQA